MKYSILIINSDDVYIFYDNAAEGIRYNDINKEELDKLLELSLIQDFSVVVQKYE